MKLDKYNCVDRKERPKIRTMIDLLLKEGVTLEEIADGVSHSHNNKQPLIFMNPTKIQARKMIQEREGLWSKRDKPRNSTELHGIINDE